MSKSIVYMPDMILVRASVTEFSIDGNTITAFGAKFQMPQHAVIDVDSAGQEEGAVKLSAGNWVPV